METPLKNPPPLTPKDSLSVEVELKALKWNNDGLFAVAEDLKNQLATAQAQLRRKDEALKFIQVKSKHLMDGSFHPMDMERIFEEIHARAALADGKEGGR